MLLVCLFSEHISNKAKQMLLMTKDVLDNCREILHYYVHLHYLNRKKNRNIKMQDLLTKYTSPNLKHFIYFHMLITEQRLMTENIEASYLLNFEYTQQKKGKNYV